MRVMHVWRIAIGLILLISPTFAKDVSPWFGSDASAPEQISLIKADDQLIDTAQISKDAVSNSEQMDCQTQGCPKPANLGKRAN